MTDWLENVKDIVRLVAGNKAILGVGAGGLALVSVSWQAQNLSRSCQLSN